MKKTLFLSAILATALCSSAFAETGNTAVIGGTTYTDVSTVSGNTGTRPEGHNIVITGITGSGADYTFNGQLNNWLRNLTSDDTIFAAPSDVTLAEAETSTHYNAVRLNFSGNTSHIVNANITAGGRNGDDIRLGWSDTDTNTKLVLKGNLTICNSAMQIWNQAGTHYIEGALNGADKELIIVGHNTNASITFSGGATLGTLNAKETSAQITLSNVKEDGTTPAASKTYTIGTLKGNDTGVKLSIQEGVTATIGTMANSYKGTITNAGTLNFTNANLAANAVIDNSGSLNVTGTLTVDSGTSTLKGNATLNKIQIGDDANKMLVVDGGNVTFGQLNGQNLGGSSARIRFANGATLTSTSRLWANGSTLHLKNTTVDGVTTGGTLTLSGFLSGVSDNTTSVGNLSIDEKVTLKITGTPTAPASGGTDNGFIIWNGAAHTYTINGALVIENGIRAQKRKSPEGTTSSTETYNIGSNGLLQLNKGLTFVTSDSTLETMGTINVNGGTLAIGGQTSGSKQAKAVNLNDGSKVIAIDANTSTEQVFTLHNYHTVTFSGKGLDGTANNHLTVNSTINNNTAAVDSVGHVTFGDMNTVRLTVDGTTTVDTLTTPKVIMKANASLTMAGADTTINTLTLNNASTVTLGSATQGGHDYDLTTTALTVSGESAVLNANLVVNSGTITFENSAVLTMGCDVTLGDGVKVYITGDIASIRNGLDTVTIIDGLTSLDEAHLGSATVYVNGTKQDDFFLDTVEDTVYGGYKIVVAPEPATATLSLLALAALAARRKRH